MTTYTLGGDRLGSGKKMRGSMHNYFRSTHNLSEKFRTSMGSGILYPAMCKVAMRGDTFDIGIAADCRTIPTQGPLFGSYKMQVDIFQCPIRLYQGILHNNPLAIGLQMNKVLFPQLEIAAKYKSEKGLEFNNSCLLKYLGMSGLGANQDRSVFEVGRRINALPALAYYDIFKTYYANKQEDNAYVITGENFAEQIAGTTGKIRIEENGETTLADFGDDLFDEVLPLTSTYLIRFYVEHDYHFVGRGGLSAVALEYQVNGDVEREFYFHEFYTSESGNTITLDDGIINLKSRYLGGDKDVQEYIITYTSTNGIDRIVFNIPGVQYVIGNVNTLKITEFELANIDKMRYDLLSKNQLGTRFVIKENGSDGNYLPYSSLVNTFQDPGTVAEFKRSLNELPLNGLVLKTYQNDILNNWLNTEWIEGENGINELSKVQVDENGNFSMDALSFASKLYNMLNRIAVAGATYEDWQDAVYETVKRRQIESPIFCGGMSQEVIFDEIVQTAPAGEGVLGTLGGRGRLNGKQKGGKVHIKCDEACFIIAIVSLTPRQSVTQSNEFYMTDLESMDDLHKPAMDGIGFQDLIGERLAWFDTKVAKNENNVWEIKHRSKIGKLPAWIEYMTSIDKAYGDFAKVPDGDGQTGAGFMILNRNYEWDNHTRTIKDATTYIDPQKYNYAFAYTALDAQNFWVQINFDIKARRLMSARLIPNV